MSKALVALVLSVVAGVVVYLLTQEGVEQMAAEGQPFDPSYHEAMAILPASGAEADTVIAEIQKGYLYRDQLLRPAKVHVAGTPNHE